jgi:hypothetical protein
LLCYMFSKLIIYLISINIISLQTKWRLYLKYKQLTTDKVPTSLKNLSTS